MVREYAYVFAAVCPSLGKMTALILPYCNKDMTRLLPRQVAIDFEKYFVITLLDRASWHTSDPLVVPENIRLIPQLAGSPELSPTEHVWDDLREKEMANHAFESLDQVEDSLCKGINRLCDNPEYLKKMTNLPYLNRNFLDAT